MQIIALVNDVEKAIQTKDSAIFLNALEQLEEATRGHFQNEESIARAVNFPFEQHEAEHGYILGEFGEIKRKWAENQGRWSESLVEYYFMFLSTWAVDHVLEDDMKMKAVLENYPYDFAADD